MQVQNQVGNFSSGWDITGEIVEVKSYDQYVVKIHGSGRMITRNRKFLKAIKPYGLSPKNQDRRISLQSDVSVPPLETQSDSYPAIEPGHSVLDDEANERLCPDDGTKILSEEVPSDQFGSEQSEVRRSKRVSKPPDRLSIENWNSKSYDKEVSQASSTTTQSVCHSHDISPVLSLGGGGINDIDKGRLCMKVDLRI